MVRRSTSNEIRNALHDTNNPRKLAVLVSLEVEQAPASAVALERPQSFAASWSRLEMSALRPERRCSGRTKLLKRGGFSCRSQFLPDEEDRGVVGIGNSGESHLLLDFDRRTVLAPLDRLEHLDALCLGDPREKSEKLPANA